MYFFSNYGVFFFSRCIPRSGTAGSYGNSIFRFSRNLCTALHSGCTNLHFCKQCRRVQPGCFFKIHVLCGLCISSVLLCLSQEGSNPPFSHPPEWLLSSPLCGTGMHECACHPRVPWASPGSGCVVCCLLWPECLEPSGT